MKYFCVLFFFLASVHSIAQDKTYNFNHKTILLSEFLTQLETIYNVKFSYNARTLEKATVSIQLKEATLGEIISEIEHQLHFVFSKIDERYYTIRNSNNINFCGYLKDEKNGNPLVGAAVLNTTSTIGTISNSEGYFSLHNIAITDTLSISFLGYNTHLIPVKKIQSKKCQIYTLKQEEFVLNEVVIKEYLASGITKINDGAIAINPTNLDALSGLSEPDILQNIQLLPGIESPSETASGIYIRGGTPDQNLILWDGIKMYNSDHFFGMVSAFNPYIAKEVKVYRSGVKSEYGDRVSGVIDIRTDNEVPEKNSVGIGINMINGDVYLKRALTKNIGLLFSARRSITDFIETPTFTRFSNKVFQGTNISENQSLSNSDFYDSNEQFYFTDVTLKIIANLSKKDQITVSNLFTKNKLDYSFESKIDDDLSSDNLRITNSGTNTVWTRDWNPNFTSKAQFYFSQYELGYEGVRTFFNANPTIKENEISEIGISFQGDWNINKNLKFSNGYQFYSNEVAFRLDEQNDISTNKTHAFYSQLSYSPAAAWHFDLGFRVNHFSRLKKTLLEPRLYTENKISNNFRIKASAEFRTQSISQIIEFTTLNFGLENQVWALTNDEDIPLLKSHQYSAGFLYTKNGFNIDVDLYHKKTSGLTSFTRGFLLSSVNFSTGQSSSKGIDILVKKKINNYATWLGYTFSNTRFNFNTLNNGKTFRGNNDISNSLTWSHFYKWNSLQLSLGWKYRTGIPFTAALGILNEENSPEINFGPLNAERLSDYHRLDFSIVYDFKLSDKPNATNGKIGFSLLNLYGKQNILSKNYILVETTDLQNNNTFNISEVNKFSLGITPNFFVRFNF